MSGFSKLKKNKVSKITKIKVSLSVLHFWEAVCRTKRYKHSLTLGPLSLYKRHRDIESVLNDSLGLHNKPQGCGA